MTPSGIEPTTFRIVAQCLYQNLNKEMIIAFTALFEILRLRFYLTEESRVRHSNLLECYYVFSLANAYRRFEGA